MDEYIIERDATEGYQVRTCEHGHTEVVARFATLAEAQAWVDEQGRIGLRSTGASDLA